MSILDFVLSQNAEPQSMLLSLVPNKKIRFGIGSNNLKDKDEINDDTPMYVANLRPKFVFMLLQLVQERHGWDSVDLQSGMVSCKDTRKKILEEYNSFCNAENAWSWFPCPRPLGVYCEDILCFKLVVEIIDLSPGDGLDAFNEKVEQPRKRKLDSLESGEDQENGEVQNGEVQNEIFRPPGLTESFEEPIFSVLDDLMRNFIYYLYVVKSWDTESEHVIAFRAWSLTSPDLKSIDTTKSPGFCGLTASVMCLQNMILPAIFGFSEWLKKNAPALSKRVDLHHFQEKNLWLSYMDAKEYSNPDVPNFNCGIQDEDKKIFEVTVNSSSNKGGSNKEKVLQLHAMHYYPCSEIKIFNNTRKSSFNNALQFIDFPTF